MGKRGMGGRGMGKEIWDDEEWKEMYSEGWKLMWEEMGREERNGED